VRKLSATSHPPLTAREKVWGLAIRNAYGMSRILIAEDEPRLASFLEKGLRANGFTT
jgi:hypothetical protein